MFIIFEKGSKEITPKNRTATELLDQLRSQEIQTKEYEKKIVFVGIPGSCRWKKDDKNEVLGF